VAEGGMDFSPVKEFYIRFIAPKLTVRRTGQGDSKRRNYQHKLMRPVKPRTSR